MKFPTTRRSALLSMVAGAAVMLALPALAQDVTITFWGSYGNGGNSTQQDAEELVKQLRAFARSEGYDFTVVLGRGQKTG